MSKNMTVIILLLVFLYLLGCQPLTSQPNEPPISEPTSESTPIPSTLPSPASTPITSTSLSEKLDDIMPITPTVVINTTPYPLQNDMTPNVRNGTPYLTPVTDTVWVNIVNRVEQIQGFRTLALSPDGKLLGAVEARLDETYYVHLWDALTGVTLWTQESDEPIGTTFLRFSPDGTLLSAAASGYVQQVFVWEVTNGALVRKFDFSGYTNSLSLSSDSKWLAVASFDEGGAVMWNLEDGTLTKLGPGTGIDFAPNDSHPLLAIARGWRFEDEESPVLLWNWDTTEVRYLYQDAFYSDGIAFSPDGRFLATVVVDEGGNGHVRLWDLQEEVEIPIQDSAIGSAQVRHVVFSQQGHLAVLADTLTLWDVQGDLLAQISAENIQGILFMPDGFHLLSYNYDDPVVIWKIP